eukprot:TRINITY_DN70_c0_g1_i2.p3 TRINITY_DN70_c0_g1~~TRINITY_DN70_c0_g1_i2.p3  ORF type:complete len:160 (+),score=70.80 TRINITY_DN70_c0_g1_i2:123-602(+)
MGFNYSRMPPKTKEQPKTAAKEQAKKVTKKVKKGAKAVKRVKVWTKITFRRPKTRLTPAAHKVKRVSYQKFPTRDKYTVVRYPVSSESAIRTIEDNNTLVFVVDPKATKKHIRKACEQLYNFKPVHVNTLIRPDGSKKAYIKVPKEQEALEIANKIGIM